MTFHQRDTFQQGNTEATLAEVLAWAEAAGESYDAVRELKKAPARLGLHDDDLALVPADPGHFERTLAPSSYASVSRSHDIEAARRRGNARLRALLGRFHAAHATGTATRGEGRADWDALIGWIDRRSAPPGRGGRFAMGKARSLFILRGRAGCPPQLLTEHVLERIAREVNADKRKVLRRAVVLLEQLRCERDGEIAHLLPRIALAPPQGVERLARIAWASLPERFRTSAERVIETALSTYQDQATEARRRLAAGEDPDAIRAAFNAAPVKHIGNREASRRGYRGAIAWLVHARLADGGRIEDLADLGDVFSLTRLDAAVAWQIERARRSPHHRDPERSQTLHSYLTSLRVVAERGLRDPALVLAIDLVFRDAEAGMRKPGRKPGDELSLFCRLVQSSPQIAYRIVNAPAELFRIARERLEEAQAKPAHVLGALRLFAAAAMASVQMSRPLRTGSLRHARAMPTNRLAGHFRRCPDGFIAHFPAGEIKNLEEIEFEIVGGEAECLREWLTVHRPRYIALRNLGPSPYLFPGGSSPGAVKNALDLPHGCMSAGSFDIVWRDAMDELGLRMTIHQCRHALATLILAIHPGDYGRVAAFLGDRAETVRKYYGRDDARAAARYLREVLLAAHPNLERRFKGRLA